MNREDIIRMALEVGLEQDGDNFFSPKSDPQVDVHITDLETFAAIVASVRQTWVGLTDKEILADDVLRYHFGLNGGAGPVSKSGRKIVDALEAKLRSKND
jgi:hypothetical protein